MSENFCAECGAPHAPGATFCGACGSQFGAAPAAGGDAAGFPPAGGPPSGPPKGPAPVAPPPSGPPSGPPPGPPPVAPPPPPVTPAAGPASGAGDGKNRTLMIVAVAAVVALLAVVLGVVLLGGDDEAAADVLLEPVAVEVPDPFTSTAAIGERALAATTTTGPAATATTGPAATATTSPRPGAGGGAVVGSAPGLYGGTRDQASCDPDKLVAFLQAEPDKAAAWASVQGIPVAEIPSYVASLTPVILRHDTRVLNHGYRDGEATPRPAVLQAGTAVMVDEYGIPRVKCACGNPLDEPPPVTTSTRYTGQRWDGFDPATVVVVRQDVQVSVFVLVDIDTGAPFTRPTGTKGDDDTDAEGATPTSSTTTTTTAPAATTTTTTPPASSEGTSAPVLFEITSIQGTSNGPTAPSVADLPAARITAIVTYHWNSAAGAAPGTVALRAEDGTVYGPFQAAGSEGQGGVPNAYWTAVTDFSVPAGRYTVVDSSPGTWSWAPDTGGRGMVTIYGIAQTTTPSTSPTTAGAPDRSQEALDAVEGAFCPTPGVEDWRQYITEMRATETDFELYRVEVDIVLDSGSWTALFDVDFATEGGPEIRPVNDESADLLC